MTLSDFASIGSLVSGLAVLVSLVYLSQQTRQNAKHTRALINQGRAAMAQGGMMEWIATDPSFAEAYLRGAEGDTTIDRIQLARFLFAMNSTLFTWEDLFYQYQVGLVEEPRHQAMTATIGFALESPGSRAVWKMARRNFGTEFQAFVDGVLSDETATHDALAVWKSLVAAEQSKPHV